MDLQPLFVAFLLFSFLGGGASDLTSDRAALLALRDAVGRTVLRWNATDSPCTWQGVRCLQNRVDVLRLPAVGLIGEIPAGTIGNLTALRTLSLRYNGLSGSLPSDLAGAAELRNLYLQDNRFSGDIPSVLFKMQKLVRLNLAGNGFTGRISPAFGNLTRLRTLYLERNQLEGSIPNIDLPLAQFNVSYNRLNGSVPSGLKKMPASSFIGMSLCGGPLAPCPGEISPGPAPGPAGIPGGKGGGRTGSDGSGSKLSGGAIAGIAVGSAAVVLILLILLVFVCRRSGGGKTRAVEAAAVAAKPPETVAGGRERGEAAAAAAAAAAATGVAAEKKPDIGKRLVFFGRAGDGQFDLEDLLRASAEVLGKGTFGTAYKALLEIGAVVAVKRLRDVNLAEQEFREKIEAVGSMDHENLVPLKAYYFSKDEKLLVYDYMSMGSLSALLHGNRGSGRTPLNWETRLSIAFGAARGIEYIHSLNPTVSHGNIKSSNVLLTKSYEARVSDHGLATLVGPSTTTSRIAGYRAPEVTDIRKVSQKADVYSFGVLLLELLTGKAPAQALLNEEGVDLPRWVQSVVREEWSSEVFDLELLRYQNVEEEMVQLLQLAIDCAAQYPDSRPSMPEVVARIERIRSLTGAAANIQEQQHQQLEPRDTEVASNDQSSQQTDSVEHTKSAGADS